MSKYVKRIILEDYEIAELALKICGFDVEEIDDDELIDTADQALADTWFTDIVQFRDMIERLLPLVNVVKSDLSGEIYKGFADIENMRWIVKTNHDNNGE